MPKPPIWPDYERHLRDVVAPTHRRLREILEEWKDASFWASDRQGATPIPQPIQHIASRDKRLESVLDKFQRQPDDFPGGQTNPRNLLAMRDLLGARIVVYVPDQLRLIDEAIRTSQHLELVADFKPRCYLPRDTFDRIGFDPAVFDFRGSKPSGYSSVHYFARLARSPVADSPVFEIQTRTMLEQVWGEIEHQLGYKERQGTEFSVARQFRVISSHMAALDDHFDFLYDRLTYLQSRSRPRNKDYINAENLPRILHDNQILLRQSEVDGLLRIMRTWGIERVSDLRERLSPANVEAIRKAHSRHNPGEPLGAFDVLPPLAQLQGVITPSDAEAAYEAGAASAAYTQRLRRDLRIRVRR